MKTTNLQPVVEVLDEHYKIPQLNRTRRIAALLPHDYYQTDKEYPIIYLLDGQNLYSKDAPYGSWNIRQSLSQMAGKGHHEVIIIAIDHGDEERIMEYFPYYNPRFGQGEGELLLQFFMKDLIPEVEGRYRVKKKRESRAIGGSSLGGLFSLYAGMKRPLSFGNLLVFSPSLWISPQVYADLERFYSIFPTDFYLYAGEKESKDHASNVRRVSDVLFRNKINASKLRFHLSINPEGTHSEVYWGEEFPKAMSWLFFDKNSNCNRING